MSYLTTIILMTVSFFLGFIWGIIWMLNGEQHGARTRYERRREVT